MVTDIKDAYLDFCKLLGVEPDPEHVVFRVERSGDNIMIIPGKAGRRLNCSLSDAQIEKIATIAVRKTLEEIYRGN